MKTTGQTVASNLHACQIISGRDTERVAKQIDAAVRERFAKHRELIRNYLGNGGLFNPELMEHEKVRDMLMAIAAEIDAAPECPACGAKSWRTKEPKSYAYS